MSPAMTSFLETLPPSDRGDLDPAGQQLELYSLLLRAVAGRVGDIAGWLVEQTWCSSADWLAVAHLWGGEQLQQHLLGRLERMGLVPA
jgi:hypothetical protein